MPLETLEAPDALEAPLMPLETLVVPLAPEALEAPLTPLEAPLTPLEVLEAPLILDFTYEFEEPGCNPE